MTPEQVDPPGSLEARLIGLALVIFVPVSAMGLFVVGGRRDCALASQTLLCADPGTWIVVSMLHAASLVVLLAITVIGTYFRIKRGDPPLQWAARWGIVAPLVSVLGWWIGIS